MRGRGEPVSIIHEFETGRDKPVPYSSVVRSSIS